jgi:hypothetical protein
MGPTRKTQYFEIFGNRAIRRLDGEHGAGCDP